MPQRNDVEKREDATVHGLAPHKTIDITAYNSSNIPNDWNIVGVTGDILMVEYADTAEGDDNLVMRNGVYVSRQMTNAVWRVGKIVKAGPGASNQAKEGVYVMFPGDKGIPMTKFQGHNYIFINEERIFAFVEPKK